VSTLNLFVVVFAAAVVVVVVARVVFLVLCMYFLRISIVLLSCSDFVIVTFVVETRC